MGAVGECREKPEALLQAPDGPGLRHRDTGPGEFAPQFPSPGASETEAHLRRNPAKPTWWNPRLSWASGERPTD